MSSQAFSYSAGSLVNCGINRFDTEGIAHLTGRACADVAMRIRYCMMVAQADDSNETKYAELGEIDLAANQPMDFAHTEINAGRSYDVRLIISWDDGSMECQLAAG